MSYERSGRRSQSSSQRGAFTYWLPLAFTVTAATIGIAAWIWSERNGDDDEYPSRPPRDSDSVYDRPDNRDGSIRTGPPPYADVGPGEVAYGTVPGPRSEETQSYMARMSGALRRTPSPQQVFDSASRSVFGGIGAVGAAVGSALGSIREEDRSAYIDHKTWSEEAAARALNEAQGPINLRVADQTPGVAPSQRVAVSNGKKRTVAIVVSADTHPDDFEEDEGAHHEHASILSHLPRDIDHSKVRLFVLIYAPGLKEHPLDATAARPPGSLSSSFSNIGHDQAQTPLSDSEKQLTSTSPSPAFNVIYSQALALVEKETMVLPFITPTGHVHILRHLGPEIIYLQESLAGEQGSVITHLHTWLRQDVILVVGADGGHGGLADSESEAEHFVKKEHWWEREERVGRGRGVVVVEGLRVGDDWARRIENKD
ncbi:peroxin 22-like protein [Diplocarpon rosae]|nr:peroxin 22-like protein [Diplocarpon rosae]